MSVRDEETKKERDGLKEMEEKAEEAARIREIKKSRRHGMIF
jgi:hypothetical protein